MHLSFFGSLMSFLPSYSMQSVDFVCSLKADAVSSFAFSVQVVLEYFSLMDCIINCILFYVLYPFSIIRSFLIMNLRYYFKHDLHVCSALTAALRSLQTLCIHYRFISVLFIAITGSKYAENIVISCFAPSKLKSLGLMTSLISYIRE